jgi:hypothetical protein
MDRRYPQLARALVMLKVKSYPSGSVDIIPVISIRRYTPTGDVGFGF